MGKSKSCLLVCLQRRLHCRYSRMDEVEYEGTGIQKMFTFPHPPFDRRAIPFPFWDCEAFRLHAVPVSFHMSLFLLS
jgi:hypothetical protein